MRKTISHESVDDERALAGSEEERETSVLDHLSRASIKSKREKNKTQKKEHKKSHTKTKPDPVPVSL